MQLSIRGFRVNPRLITLRSVCWMLHILTVNFFGVLLDRGLKKTSILPSNFSVDDNRRKKKHEREFATAHVGSTGKAESARIRVSGAVYRQAHYWIVNVTLLILKIHWCKCNFSVTVDVSPADHTCILEIVSRIVSSTFSQNPSIQVYNDRPKWSGCVAIPAGSKLSRNNRNSIWPSVAIFIVTSAL